MEWRVVRGVCEGGEDMAVLNQLGGHWLSRGGPYEINWTMFA